MLRSCFLLVLASAAGYLACSATAPQLPPDLVLLRHVRKWAQESSQAASRDENCAQGRCGSWRGRYTCSASIKTSHVTVTRSQSGVHCTNLHLSDALKPEESSCFAEVWMPFKMALSDASATSSASHPLMHGVLVADGQRQRLCPSTPRGPHHHAANTSSWIVIDVSNASSSSRQLSVCWTTTSAGNRPTRCAGHSAALRYRIHHFQNSHRIAQRAFLALGSRKAEDFESLSEELKVVPLPLLPNPAQHQIERSRRSSTTDDVIIPMASPPSGAAQPDDMNTATTSTSTTTTTAQTRTKKRKTKMSRQQRRQERKQKALLALLAAGNSTATPAPATTQPPARFCQPAEAVNIKLHDIGWLSVLAPDHIAIRNCAGSCRSPDMASSNEPRTAFTGYTKFALLKNDILENVDGSLASQGIPTAISMCCVPSDFTNFSMLLYLPPQVNVTGMADMSHIADNQLDTGSYRYVMIEKLVPNGCACA